MMLNLKPTHKLIQAYYSSIKELSEKGHQHEGAVAPAFASLLQHCASLTPHLNFVQQFPFKGDNKKPLRADGVLVDRSTNVLIYGIWEAKDLQDHLEKEIHQKFQKGSLMTMHQHRHFIRTYQRPPYVLFCISVNTPRFKER